MDSIYIFMMMTLLILEQEIALQFLCTSALGSHAELGQGGLSLTASHGLGAGWVGLPQGVAQVWRET